MGDHLANQGEYRLVICKIFAPKSDLIEYDKFCHTA